MDLLYWKMYNYLIISFMWVLLNESAYSCRLANIFCKVTIFFLKKQAFCATFSRSMCKKLSDLCHFVFVGVAVVVRRGWFCRLQACIKKFFFVGGRASICGQRTKKCRRMLLEICNYQKNSVYLQIVIKYRKWCVEKLLVCCCVCRCWRRPCVPSSRRNLNW